MRPFQPKDLAWMHALNQANKVELSDETPEGFSARASRACMALVCESEAAFMLGFDQRPTPPDAPGSINWDWLAARLERFVYLDRIAVAAHARGQGIARAMYERLFVDAAALGAERIACEVNSDPPNPASEAFHAAMGFDVIGEATLQGGKIVRYFMKELQP